MRPTRGWIKPPEALAITTTSPLPTGVIGTPYDVTLTATGGSGARTWSLAARSKLPRGLTLAADGRLSGTPTQAGSWTVTVQVSAGGSTATMALGLTVATALTITTGKLPAASLGVAYSTTLVATGGIPPYAWSVAGGALPAGLALDPSTGVISGTPTTRATSTFTIGVTDAQGRTAMKSLRVSVR